MFKRKLEALKHHNPESLNMNDEKSVRILVLWLEDQKIRHYKIEDRENLRQITNPEWKLHFAKYLEDVGCPLKNAKLVEQLEWLIGYAVKLEYSDNVDKYKRITAENVKQNKSDAPKVISSNPLDKLDFESADFKNGVNKLAELLKITSHPDHLVTLQAISKVVTERLNAECLKNPSSIVPKGVPFPFRETESGFVTNDKVLAEASKILKLLFIQDLRQLQTQINECIVAVQKVTANPKTDTKLGKVGF
ncbi:hypothetical protein V9T40_011013 [Parthenolecanium corni]|uniref:RNA transcription, translation and transport factor protein n=1 Tax=Parthenolecanium corni TaxID=536013 RepID=A0AAN9XY08_9HEMI